MTLGEHGVASLAPQHMIIARQFIGVKEIPGGIDHPDIVRFHSVTAAGEAPDEVPWCSSYVCYPLHVCGIPHTRSKAARSWLTYGVPVEPIVGAIVVFKWPSGNRHVAFCEGLTEDRKRIVVLGGNQGNEVNTRSYPIKYIEACRMPAPPILDDPGSSGSTR